MHTFRSQECVSIDGQYGTLVGDDTLLMVNGHAVVLLFPEFRIAGDNGLIEVPLTHVNKQYT